MAISLLLIDDDARLRTLLREYLTQNDVLVKEASDGRSGLAALATDGADVVVLDVMMPGLDGLSVLKKLRETSAVPVIMLTAKGEESDRVVGLELGADDYLTKPFSPRELLARLRAVLRRGQGGPSGAWLRAGDVELQRETRQARLQGAPLELTGLEFDLLCALAERRGRVLPRQTLWELAGRGDTSVSDRTLDVHISNLRKKLREDERKVRLIQTIRGVGYLFATDNS
jgi:two-component system, OmpR family, response regulator